MERNSAHPFEGSGIDPEWLKREIQNRVALRRSSGLYNEDVDSNLRLPFPPDESSRKLSPIERLDLRASTALARWEVTPAYPVTTEKRFLGPLVIFLKRIARLWARIAVGPMARSQSLFNREAADAIDALREYALAQRAASREEEEDLCLLAEAMSDGEEELKAAELVPAPLEGSDWCAVLGPCPERLAAALESKGYRLLRVDIGGAWQDAEAATVRLEEAPSLFLERLPEFSLDSIFIPEIAFWLRPERLMWILRKSYLALKENGMVALLVRGFASGSRLSPWCGRAVLAKALELAGFKGVTVRSFDEETAEGGFLARGRKL